MSKPALTAKVEISTLTFEDRVKLVHEEIQRRKNEANPENPTYFVASLWLKWLKKTVLDVPAGRGVVV